MPEYFAIKNAANNPLWWKYINWLNKTYYKNWTGNATAYYGYVGESGYHGTGYFKTLRSLQNSIVELTLEQWNQIVNKNKMEEFKLPEFWQIKRDENNYKIINDWMNKHHNVVGEVEEYTHVSGIVNNKNKNKSGNNNLPKITTEQFIKYVLNKQENMKEIIGYKLKEDCKQYEEAAEKIAGFSNGSRIPGKFNNWMKVNPNGCFTYNLKEAGVLELWFEPVYEKKFKVGDWIAIENSNELESGCKGCKEGIYQVIPKPMNDSWNGLSKDDNGFFVETFDKIWKISNIGVRLATPEEIQSAQTLKFGGYGVTFEKVTSGVRITCNGETGTFSQIEAIYNYFKPNSTYFKFGSQEVKRVEYFSGAAWNLEYEKEAAKSIKIGCTTGTWKEFVAIYKKAKSML